MDVGKDEAFALPVPDTRARCQMPKFLSHGVG